MYRIDLQYGHLKIDKTKILMKNGSLMKVESIAVLEHFAVLLTCIISDNWSWKPIFGPFESGRFTQVLLYKVDGNGIGH